MNLTVNHIPDNWDEKNFNRWINKVYYQTRRSKGLRAFKKIEQ